MWSEYLLGFETPYTDHISPDGALLLVEYLELVF